MCGPLESNFAGAIPKTSGWHGCAGSSAMTNCWRRNPDWNKFHGMSDVTLILDAIHRGESQASEKLLPLVYDELRKVAAARMAREAPGQTLQPTALVHEAWLRLMKDEDQTWQNRAFFFHAAAEAMRRILIENARRKSAVKHGGGRERLNIDELELGGGQPDEKVLMVNAALEQLEQVHPERAKIVVLKYFGGMTNEEVAKTLGIGERTVYRHWLCAKVWLFDKLGEGA
jgi:RNA polymerase sigma factor (TIGR02999 family)